jgi:hypothetical protein
MAEIGLAASIIAVIQITTAVTTQAYKYGQNIAKAKEDIERVREELVNLEAILKQLKELASGAEISGESCKYTIVLQLPTRRISPVPLGFPLISYSPLDQLPAVAKTYR